MLFISIRSAARKTTELETAEPTQLGDVALRRRAINRAGAQDGYSCEEGQKCLTPWVDLRCHQYPENVLLADLGWGFHPKITL